MHPGIVTILEAVRRAGPDLAAYKSLGQIYAAREGDLLLFNYTARATYERAYSSRQARRDEVVSCGAIRVA